MSLILADFMMYCDELFSSMHDWGTEHFILAILINFVLFLIAVIIWICSSDKKEVLYQLTNVIGGLFAIIFGVVFGYYCMTAVKSLDNSIGDWYASYKTMHPKPVVTTYEQKEAEKNSIKTTINATIMENGVSRSLNFNIDCTELNNSDAKIIAENVKESFIEMNQTRLNEGK